MSAFGKVHDILGVTDPLSLLLFDSSVLLNDHVLRLFMHTWVS